MSWRLAAGLIVSMALHAGLAGITYRLVGEVFPDALFIDLTLVPLDEEPVAVARAEQNSAAPLGPGAAARSATEERAKPRHPTAQPLATPGEKRRAPRPAAPEPAPAERTSAPTTPVPPPPLAAGPAPAIPTPAPAPAITVPTPPAAPPPANEPAVATPAIPPGPPQVASLPPEARAPESSSANPGRNASPDTSPRERPEQGATAAAGAGAGDGGAASGREGGAVALAFPGDGRGGEREYAAYYRLLRGRVVESVKYPPTARRDGLTGTVEMDLFVEPTGAISRVVVVASSSHRVLDDAAVAAVRRVGQVPFPEHLHPRPLRIRLPVVFVLQ